MRKKLLYVLVLICLVIFTPTVMGCSSAKQPILIFPDNVDSVRQFVLYYSDENRNESYYFVGGFLSEDNRYIENIVNANVEAGQFCITDALRNNNRRPNGSDYIGDWDYWAKEATESCDLVILGLKDFSYNAGDGIKDINKSYCIFVNGDIWAIYDQNDTLLAAASFGGKVLYAAAEEMMDHGSGIQKYKITEELIGMLGLR